MSILIELWDFVRSRKKLWIMPIFIMLMVFGGLMVFAQGSVVAPFIYTLF